MQIATTIPQLPLLRVGDVLDTKPNQGWFGDRREVRRVNQAYNGREDGYEFTIIRWTNPADAYVGSTCSHRRYCVEIAQGNWKLITYPDHLALPVGV